MFNFYFFVPLFPSPSRKFMNCVRVVCFDCFVVPAVLFAELLLAAPLAVDLLDEEEDEEDAVEAVPLVA